MLRSFAVPLTAVAVAVAVAGCGGDKAPAEAGTAPTPAVTASSPAPSAEPVTEQAAKAAASEMFEAFSSGDYGAAWDLWSGEAQKTMSRADYLRLNELCRPAAEGVPITLKKVRLEGTVAIVRAERVGMGFTYRFTHEAGRWVYVPDKEVLAEYRSGTVEQIAAKRRKDSRCA